MNFLHKSQSDSKAADELEQVQARVQMLEARADEPAPRSVTIAPAVPKSEEATAAEKDKKKLGSVAESVDKVPNPASATTQDVAEALNELIDRLRSAGLIVGG